MTHRQPGRVVLAGLLAALLALPAGGAVAAAPRRATRAVLTTGTRVEWTGVKGIRLTFPRTVRLDPVYAAQLFVRGGTYASVWMVPGETCDGRPCAGVGMSIEYTRDMAGHFANGTPPGKDHWAVTTNSGWYGAGDWDFYLFTDGHATLVFDTTGLPRRAQAFTAAGRVRGSFAKLPEFCGTDLCTPGSGYAGRAHTGGMYGDVGRWGYSGGFVAHYSTNEEWVPQSHGLRGCAYRAAPDESGSPAQAHPLGCDLNPEYADAWVLGYAGFASPQYSGAGRGMGIDRAAGRVYLGFQFSNAHDLSGAIREAWGVWFEYGVH